MAWTNPRTWVSGEIVTAALLNAHLRDNLLDIAYVPWIPAPLAVGANFGAGFQSVKYRRMGDRVELRGLLGGLTGGLAVDAILFTLPAGFRPAATEAFATIATGVLLQVDVRADGVVSNRSAVPVNGNISFSGLSFSTLA